VEAVGGEGCTEHWAGVDVNAELFLAAAHREHASSLLPKTKINSYSLNSSLLPKKKSYSRLLPKKK